MARQPVQTGLARSLQTQAAQAAASRRYLADQLSRRVGQSEFAAARARAAALEAFTAAAAAQTAAAGALAAAETAYAQAAAAASAAGVATGAAAAANDRASVLEKTDLWATNAPATPGTQVVLPSAASGFSPADDCAIDQDFGPYPLLVTFSVELRPGTTGDNTTAEITLSSNGVEIPSARRLAIFSDSASLDTTVALPPLAGRNHVEALWSARVGSARCVSGRRQLSVLRLGTP